MIFTIPEYKKEKVLKKIQALNKRARTLGVQGIRYYISLPYTKEFTFGENEFQEPIKYEVSLVDFDLDNTLVSLNGWAFLAVIEHTKNGNIILKKLYDVDVPEQYRESAEYCEHCKTKRYRKYTYLVYNEVESKIYQVGSTCINNYLGFDATFLMNHASMIDFLRGMGPVDGDMGWFGTHGTRVERTIDLNKFLDTIASYVRQYPYVSAKKGREEGLSATGSDVWYAMTTTMKHSEFEKTFINPTEEDIETRNKALEWLTTQDTKQDYIYNLSVAVKNGYITHKVANLVASLIPVYQMNIRRNEEKKVVVPSNHIGTVGQRIEMTVKVIGIYTTDGRFGTTYIHHFVEGEGNRVVWFGSKQLEEGLTYTGKATIKKHTEYKGVKQTIINRPKFEILE